MATAKYKKGKDGYFSTLAWDGTYNADGTKHRKQLRSKKSSRDLERIVREFNADVENRNVCRKSTMTFVEYAKTWRKTDKARSSLYTQAMYDNVINAHFSKLGNLPLSDIGRMHLFLLLDGVGDNIGHKIYITLKQVVRAAVRERYLPQSRLDDIFMDTKSPVPRKPAKRALTALERQAVRDAVLEPMDQAYLYTIYGCGLRKEEALALQREDIDFTAGEISVSKVIVYASNKPILTQRTKSERGKRRVPMPLFLRECLSEYCGQLSGSFLFPGNRDDSLTQGEFARMWKRILRAIDAAAGGKEDAHVIKGLTSHTFRHNYCTNLCYQIPTISIKKVAELMGDTENVVFGVYNHILSEREDAAAAVENAVGF